MTREEWLEKAINILRSGMFKDNNFTFPENIKVATGFLGPGLKRKAIGVYYPDKMTKNAIPQIFISPVLENTLNVLETLVHELVHACVPNAKRPHGKEFGEIARKLGLEGKLTATFAGEALKVKLNEISNTLGVYPHGAIVLRDKPKGATSLIKLKCPDCDMCCRMTNKEYIVYGGPICSIHNVEMEQSV